MLMAINTRDLFLRQVPSGQSTLNTTRALPVCEGDFVQPCGIGVHGGISIHLKGHIHFMDARAPRRITAVYIVSDPVISEADEDHVGGSPLKFPGEMVPNKSRWSRTGNPGWKPIACGVAHTSQCPPLMLHCVP